MQVTTQMKKIMVVEDDDALQEVISTILGMLGYEVCGVVDTGEGAIGEAIEHRPDLALMDINLPGHMDGIEAAPFLIDILDIPVVFMSGGLPKERMEAAMGTGPVAFQEKPFSGKDLHQVIEVGLATHAIRKKVQQQEVVSFTFPPPESPFLLTNAGGPVVYASPGARTRAPHGRTRGPMVPLQDYLAAMSPGGVPAHAGCRGAGMPCPESQESCEAEQGTKWPLTFRPLFSRQGKTIGQLVEIGDGTGNRAGACGCRGEVPV
ncbi:MAG: two-component response regulator [Methanoregulaceae archaeon PtaU1.Bin222]|nr:MAG: two-component response regulator [Methanoregulaceae archaeon PtaU1.Bin222]